MRNALPDEDRLGDEVEALLEKLARMDDADIQALAGLWAQEDAPARKRGWRTAKAAIRGGGLEPLLEDARDAVRSWASPTRSDYPGLQAQLALPNRHLEPRRAAVPAILDAVVAILASDSLGDDEYEALSQPWATVAGDDDAGDP